MKNIGKIIGLVNPYLTTYEWEAINFLLASGFNIKTIPESRTAGIKTPDLQIGRTYWEIKTIIGNNSRTIENALRTAKRQSNNIIIDLRHTPRSESQCLHEIQNWFTRCHDIKQIWVITKKKTLCKFKH